MTPPDPSHSPDERLAVDLTLQLTPPPDVTTLGRLKESGWTSVPVAEEIRRNASNRIAAGQPLVGGVLGFEDTVLPQLENALLAGHDVILLGERGQAKTRIIRSLVGLLDEWLPIVAHSEIHDDPTRPISRFAKDLLAEAGDDLPVSWVHRSDRYGEKLATPDTSIADLIGEVDPIRVAEGRYLSDELTIHYGLVPRLNRGIFAVNELPDLAERIQVGLLNVLEERDVQIRGHRVRLPLDIVLVATANPEDYTNRGRIITPLKDRFGSQIRTHYPPDAATELRIAEAEAQLPGRDGGGDGTVGRPRVEVPDFMADVVAELSQLARESPHLNQRSGVSVRLTIANYEMLVANATRRALRNGESEAVPRVSDLQALVPSTQGKVEVESLEEGREEVLLAQLVNAAVLIVFRRRVVLDGSGQRGRIVHQRNGGPRRRRPSGRRLRLHPGPDAGPVGPGGDPHRRLGGSGPGGQCAGVPVGGSAPHQAPQQRGGRLPRPLSGSLMPWRFDYSQWDGTQESLVDDTDAVLSQLTDDLLANGDLHEALQRMLNRGWRTPDGTEVQGLRDLLDQLRMEREDQLDRGDLGGAYHEVAEELQEVLAEERAGIDELESEARAFGGRASPAGDRRSRLRTEDAAGPAPGRSGRHGTEPAGVRVRLLRSPPTLRGPGRTAAGGGGPHLLRPDVGCVGQPRSGPAGPHA